MIQAMMSTMDGVVATMLSHPRNDGGARSRRDTSDYLRHLHQALGPIGRVTQLGRKEHCLCGFSKAHPNGLADDGIIAQVHSAHP
jgi:hypothetical protein